MILITPLTLFTTRLKITMLKFALFQSFPRKYDSLLTVSIRDNHNIGHLQLKAVWNILEHIERESLYIPDSVREAALHVDQILLSQVPEVDLLSSVHHLFVQYLEYRIQRHDSLQRFYAKGVRHFKLDALIEGLVRIGVASVSCLDLKHITQEEKDLSKYLRS